MSLLTDPTKERPPLNFDYPKELPRGRCGVCHAGVFMFLFHELDSCRFAYYCHSEGVKERETDSNRKSIIQ